MCPTSTIKHCDSRLIVSLSFLSDSLHVVTCQKRDTVWSDSRRKYYQDFVLVPEIKKNFPSLVFFVLLYFALTATQHINASDLLLLQSFAFEHEKLPFTITITIILLSPSNH